MNETTEFSEVKIKDKLISIQKIVQSYRLEMQGHEYVEDGKKLMHKTDCLASSEVINIAMLLLNPFSAETNLISSKEPKQLAFQYWETSTKFNQFLAKNGGIHFDTKKQTEIFTAFKNTLKNICHIILGSKITMDSYLIQSQDEAVATGNF